MLIGCSEIQKYLRRSADTVNQYLKHENAPMAWVHGDIVSEEGLLQHWMTMRIREKIDYSIDWTPVITLLYQKSRVDDSSASK